MSIIIDLIVLAIIALSIFLGYKKGLIGVIFKIVSFEIAIVLTLLLYKPISNVIINNTNFDETIRSTVIEKLSTQKIEDGKINKEETDLPGIMVDYINAGIKNTVDATRDNIVELAADNLSKTGIEIVVAVALFIIIRLLLIFAKAILEAIAELPIIRQFNELGGTIYGILRGIILVYAILAIISLLLPMLDKGAILNSINSTILTKFLYNNNLILMIFFK